MGKPTDNDYTSASPPGTADIYGKYWESRVKLLVASIGERIV
jgi:hypothetical protein